MSNPDHAERDGPQGRDPSALAVLAVGVLAMVALSWGAVAAIRPPAVRPADADPAVFSAARARVHLEAIARAPRPVGSPGHDDARTYIEQELRRFGLEVQVHEASTSLRIAGGPSTPRPTNVVARLRGADTGHGTPRDAVLLACHYDSVPGSPGAGDDGAGVAALLESARALAVGPRLARDVVFLFSDAEELGSLGARAFVREFPWAPRVAVAVNVDARGTRGASVMWKMSRHDEALLRALATAVERPVASSLVAVLGRALPNDTDGTVFAASGIPSYDFALAEGAASYHQATDDLDTLDLRSVQHHGDNALALARHLAASPAASDVSRALREGAEVAYVDLFARTLVLVPYRWVRVLVLAAVLLLLAGVTAERRASGLRVGRTLAAAATTFGAVVVASAVVVIVVTGLEATLGAGTTMQWAGPVAGGAIVVAVATVALGATSSLRFCTRPELAMGSLVPWLLLTAALGVVVPATVLPLVLPLLGVAGSLAAGASFCRTSFVRIPMMLLGLTPAAYFAATTAFTLHVLAGELLLWLPAAVIAAFTTLAVPGLALLPAASLRRRAVP